MIGMVSMSEKTAVAAAAGAHRSQFHWKIGVLRRKLARPFRLGELVFLVAAFQSC